MASIYEEWGFTGNPFTTAPLEATSTGERLLVGRDNELNLVCRRLENGPKLVTIEGGVGYGKTSLVNVASYKMFNRYLHGESDTLILPCRKTFQIVSLDEVPRLVQEVYYEAAQTLIQQANVEILSNDAAKKRKAIDKWLNSPFFKTVQGGIQILQTAISFGSGESHNDGTGFDSSGFQRTVKEWLLEIFEKGGKGGIVCVIDNMELLQESAAARLAAEALRDELFAVPGFRWVLCGAGGIIQSVVSSPRLEGVLFAPVEVGGIADAQIEEVYTSRIEAFERFPGSGYLPLTSTAFELLYEALNRNLRNLLSHADDFCLWVIDQDSHPETDGEKDDTFYRWFDPLTERLAKAVESELRPRAWQIFDRAIEIGGQFSPSDFEKFDCASIPALRPHVKDLENVGLLQSARDDNDNRRKSIGVTSKGYLVSYHRRKPTIQQPT